LEQAFRAQYAAVSRAMEEVGGAVATLDPELTERLEQAEAFIKRQDDLAQKRSRLEAKWGDARAERSAAGLSLPAAETELNQWRDAWSTKMARIGLEADAAPEQAEVVLTKISELWEKLDQRRGFASRIRGIDRDADAFAQDVAALAARVAPELAGC